MGTKNRKSREPAGALAKYKVPRQIIRAYGIEVEDIQPVGRILRIATDKGFKALKRVRYDESKINLMHGLLEHLAQQGFDRIPRLVRNQYNTHYIRRENDYYLVADWVEGRPCNFNDQTELLQAVEELARFHRLAVGMETEGLKTPGDWISKFETRKAELEQFHDLAERAERKKVFHQLYVDHYPYFVEQANTSLELLRGSAYLELWENAQQRGAICHRNFIEENLVVDKKDRIHLLNFDYAGIDLPVYDIGSLLQKIMIRNKWDFDLGLAILQAYESVNPLNSAELEVLLAVMYFPHQTWVCAGRYYKKQKGLTEKALIRQFKNIIHAKKAKESFLAQLAELVKSRKEE